MSGNAVDSSTGETLLRDYVLGNTIGQGTFSKVKIGRHVPTN